MDNNGDDKTHEKDMNECVVSDANARAYGTRVYNARRKEKRKEKKSVMEISGGR